MKKGIFFVIALVSISLLVSLFSINTTFAHNTNGVNLIANPSVEIEDLSGNPLQWLNSSWGTNISLFTYQDEGHSGVKSLHAEITSYSSGDAKWYFEPVEIAPEKDYLFGEYYRSNISTDIVIRYTYLDDSVSYKWVGSLNPTSVWTDKDFEFTTPVDAKEMTVFHVVASVGWLDTDDYSLTEVEEEVIPPSTSLVPNESLEQESANNPAVPAGWVSNSWGSNTANFEYPDEGHTGNKSVKTTVSNYSSGDAKWSFETIDIEPDTDYEFSDYYKSSVPTNVVLVTYDASGMPLYSDLASNLPAGQNNWQNVKKSFTTSVNADKISIFHVIAANGFLQIDDMTVNKVKITPPPVNGNLIPNADLEIGNTEPQGWTANMWGSLTATHSYGNFGQNNSKGVKTDVSNYSNGDAKWYFNPVDVTEGKTYSYSHFFKSTTNTEMVAQYTDGNGATTYEYLRGLAPATNWQEFTAELTIPSGIQKLSVFHVVAGVGELIIDDASLTVVNTPPPPVSTVPNNSLENSVNGTQPSQWNTNSWGSNTANFEYPDEGHTGNKSVKVTVSQYSSGDAKWSFEPVNLTSGEYLFSAWYKTNAVPKPIAMFVHTDGSLEYTTLPIPSVPNNSDIVWQLYSSSFSMPANAESVSIFFVLDSVGWLETDDYDIIDYQPQGFNRPLVTLTFDDGHEGNVETVLPVLESYGFLSTQCYATTFIENAPDEQAAIDNVLMFKNAGHEICSHTVTHPFLTQLTPSDLDYELSHSKEYLETITGEQINNFASPYGDYNSTVNNAISQYYRSHRTVDSGYNSKDNLNKYSLRVQNMLNTTTIGEFQSWLDHAQSTNTWLVLVYHVVSDNPDVYDTSTANFAEQMQTLSDSGLTVKTYNDVLNEVEPQL